jgi:EVE domain
LTGKDGGVFATVRVAKGQAYEVEIEPDDGFKDEDRIGRHVWQVGLENGRRLNRPVLKSALKADPRFENVKILTIPKAANPFPVTDEEWDAICSRI